MHEELRELILQQEADRRLGPFQRPEPGIDIHLNNIVKFIDDRGVPVRPPRTVEGGTRWGEAAWRDKTGLRGRPRTCPHGNTYRKQKYYSDGRKKGTFCTECARLKSAEWRAKGGDSHRTRKRKGETP